MVGAASQDVSRAWVEQIGNLCSLANRLANLQCSDLGILRRCRGCLNVWELGTDPKHTADCLVGQTQRVIAALQARLDADRIAEEAAERMVWEEWSRVVGVTVLCPDCGRGAEERLLDRGMGRFDFCVNPFHLAYRAGDPVEGLHLEFGERFADPVLGEMEELHLSAPVGLSHAEAAVMHAAGVPAEQRAAILAEAVNAQRAGAVRS